MVQYLSLGFTALQNYLLRNKKIRIVQSELNARLLVRTVQKTFMGLRYQCLVEKNLRLMQIKQRKALVERSFGGWRYQVMLNKTRTEYGQFRVKRDTEFFFTHWRNLQRRKAD